MYYMQTTTSSLRDLSSDAYFRDIRDFDFNVNTTFNQYVNAVDSDLVHIEQTRPPDGKTIRVNFKFDNFQKKFHLNFLGKGHDMVKFLVLTNF